jgi:hypothetical protein
MKYLAFGAACFAALFIGQAANASTHVKLTNEGPSSLTVTGGAVSPVVLTTHETFEGNVSATVSFTVTAGDSASSLKTRNYGPNTILLTFPNLTIGLAPGYAIEGDVPADKSVVISEQP